MLNKKYKQARRGFTIIELMTVIAIIVILIGILVPGIQGVKRVASNLEQKSLFHSLEIGLGIFKHDFGDYPESKKIQVENGQAFTGAQHLAEAMVGRDGRGYEPSQIRRWRSPENTDDPILYTDDDKSIARRKPRFANLKDNTGAFEMHQIYGEGNTGNVYSGNPAPVLTDVFQKKKITVPSGETFKVGSPILYYRANSGSKLFDKSGTGYGPSWIYNYDDNSEIVNLPPFFDANVERDPFNAPDFYRMINDSVFQGNPNNLPGKDKPYNENSYILISAGYDGIFGTKDDITNFKD